MTASDVIPDGLVAPDPPKEVLQPAADIVGQQVLVRGVDCNGGVSLQRGPGVCQEGR